MKKQSFIKMSVLAVAFLSFFSCKNTVNKNEKNKPLDFLKNTKIVLTNEHNFNEENPELTQEFTTKNGKHILIYKLGQAENYLLETFIQPIQKTELIKNLSIDFGQVTSKAVTESISNSISKTNSVTITNSTSESSTKLKITDNNTFSWDNIGKSLIGFFTDTGKTGTPLDTIKEIAKFASLETKTTTSSTATTQARTELFETEYQISNTVSEFTKLHIELDENLLEDNMYYTLGAIGDFDLYQVIEVDCQTNETITYFIGNLIQKSIRAKILYNSEIEFLYPSDYEFKTVSEFDVDLTKDLGDGSEDNPFKIYSATDFTKIKNNLNSYFELKNDIDFNNSSFKKFGDFTGSLDGKFHALKNIQFKDGKKSSLFYENKGTIKNIKISNYTVTHEGDGACICYINNENGIISNIIIENGKYKIEKKLGKDGFNYGICWKNNGLIENAIVKDTLFEFDLRYLSAWYINHNAGLVRKNYGTMINVASLKNKFYNGYGWCVAVDKEIAQSGLVEFNYGSITNAFSAEHDAKCASGKEKINEFKDPRFCKIVMENNGTLSNVSYSESALYSSILANCDILNNENFCSDSNGYLTLKSFADNEN
ncbi:MAG: hypothetical protein IKX23_11690 [Treponema sp.]|nr:hypothetical protein [Treponema sp.]